jgi:hypothetical protein
MGTLSMGRSSLYKFLIKIIERDLTFLEKH